MRLAKFLIIFSFCALPLCIEVEASKSFWSKWMKKSSNPIKSQLPPVMRALTTRESKKLTDLIKKIKGALGAQAKKAVLCGKQTMINMTGYWDNSRFCKMSLFKKAMYHLCNDPTTPAHSKNYFASSCHYKPIRINDDPKIRDALAIAFPSIKHIISPINLSTEEKLDDDLKKEKKVIKDLEKDIDLYTAQVSLALFLNTNPPGDDVKKKELFKQFFHHEFDESNPSLSSGDLNKKTAEISNKLQQKKDLLKRKGEAAKEQMKLVEYTKKNTAPGWKERGLDFTSFMKALDKKSKHLIEIQKNIDRAIKKAPSLVNNFNEYLEKIRKNESNIVYIAKEKAFFLKRKTENEEKIEGIEKLLAEGDIINTEYLTPEQTRELREKKLNPQAHKLKIEKVKNEIVELEAKIAQSIASNKKAALEEKIVELKGKLVPSENEKLKLQALLPGENIEDDISRSLSKMSNKIKKLKKAEDKKQKEITEYENIKKQANFLKKAFKNQSHIYDKDGNDMNDSDNEDDENANAVELKLKQIQVMGNLDNFIHPLPKKQEVREAPQHLHKIWTAENGGEEIPAHFIFDMENKRQNSDDFQRKLTALKNSGKKQKDHTFLVKYQNDENDAGKSRNLSQEDYENLKNGMILLVNLYYNNTFVNDQQHYTDLFDTLKLSQDEKIAANKEVAKMLEIIDRNRQAELEGKKGNIRVEYSFKDEMPSHVMMSEQDLTAFKNAFKSLRDIIRNKYVNNNIVIDILQLSDINEDFKEKKGITEEELAEADTAFERIKYILTKGSADLHDRAIQLEGELFYLTEADFEKYSIDKKKAAIGEKLYIKKNPDVQELEQQEEPAPEEKTYTLERVSNGENTAFMVLQSPDFTKEQVEKALKDVHDFLKKADNSAQAAKVKLQDDLNTYLNDEDGNSVLSPQKYKEIHKSQKKLAEMIDEALKAVDVAQHFINNLTQEKNEYAQEKKKIEEAYKEMADGNSKTIKEIKEKEKEISKIDKQDIKTAKTLEEKKKRLEVLEFLEANAGQEFVYDPRKFLFLKKDKHDRLGAIKKELSVLISDPSVETLPWDQIKPLAETKKKELEEENTLIDKEVKDIDERLTAIMKKDDPQRFAGDAGGG